MCYGTLLAEGGRARIPVRDIPGRRFIRMVDMAGPVPEHDEVEGPCWLWTGAVSDGGYGVFRVGPDQLVHAHIWAAEQAFGPAPPGYEWDHRCHQRDYCAGGKGDLHRRCVNAPAHLRLVESRVNKLLGCGPTAVNARKTHCHRGHPLTGRNVYVPPKRPRERQCVACRRIVDQQRAALRRMAREELQVAEAAVARLRGPAARTG